MLELKRYQRECIKKLTQYLQEARKSDPETAFIKQTKQPYKVLHGDPSAPFVCTRVPTGGGKTLIAAHAVGTAFSHYLLEKEERGLVLWMVPSDQIRTQTLLQLRDRNHSYREVLDHAFEGRVKVLDIVEARSIKPADIADNVCIVVTTLGSVRREEKEGLKVYQQSGSLMEHFRDVKNGALIKDEDGNVIQSLANVIRMNRPLVVLDEGHNAQTELSVEVIKNFLPSCILEYTATPLGGSNVLVKVPATELKKEQMVKIPIHLTNITQWQEAIRAAWNKRKELEKTVRYFQPSIGDRIVRKGVSKKEDEIKEYIRPILLLQAQTEKESKDKLHVHLLVDFLTEELKVKREEIAIKTGKEDELKEHNLFDSKCPIRYIVTCAALKEGWDCSFAYVLASVSNLGTRLGVEQLIGRILRLPDAKEKPVEELNHSYVYTSSRRFDEAANLVIKGLEQEGYHKSDIIRGDKNGERAEYEAVRAASKNQFSMRYLAIDGEPLDFYDLIPPEFSLSGKGASVELLEHLENSSVLIDIEENAVVASHKKQLKQLHLSEEETREELVRWLALRIQERSVGKSTMTTFIRRIVKNLLKKHSLAALYAKKFALRDVLQEEIRSILDKEAKKQFQVLCKAGKITASKERWILPYKMTLLHPMQEEWKKCLFTQCDELNSKTPEDCELTFAKQLDEHPQVEWWHRNVAQEPDGFRLQGYERDGFYPDFIVQTKNGKRWLLEYKGADRATSEDSEYKDALGKLWAEVCGEEEIRGEKKKEFRMVTKKNMAEILEEITSL